MAGEWKLSKKKSGAQRRETLFYTTWRRLRKNKLAMVGLVIISIMGLIAIFAPLIMPYGYEEIDIINANAGPSWEH